MSTNLSTDTATTAPSQRANRTLLRRLIKHPQGVIGMTILSLVVFAALFAPLIAPHDPTVLNMSVRMQPPSTEHVFGTDHLGRDVFSRVVYGSRVSILAGFVATTIAAVFGTMFGLLAGYLEGRFDHVIMRVTDALLAFPELVLLIAFATIFGPGLTMAMVAIGIAGIPVFTRLVRGQVLSIRGREYVEATRSLGSSHVRIASLHVLPNVLPAIIVWSSLLVGGAILAEAGLSFLGLGVQPPTPSWGSMVNQGNQYLRLAPWMSLFPGAAIFFTVLGANLMGDAMRDLGDPRMRGRLK